MAKLRNLENRPVQTLPGRELHDRDIREMATVLCKQGWTYQYHGGGRKPKIYNPDGDWTTLPLTPSSYGSVLSTRNKLKNLGADFDSAPRSSSFQGESLYSDTTGSIPETEWRRRQYEAGGWRAALHGLAPEPEPVKPEVYVPAYTREVMARLEQADPVRPDARGERGWTLSQARGLVRDGYPVRHVIERTGWGRNWLSDLESV